MAAAEAMRGTKNILTRPFFCKHEAYIRACDICNIWVEEALCIKASGNRDLGAQAKCSKAFGLSSRHTVSRKLPLCELRDQQPRGHHVRRTYGHFPARGRNQNRCRRQACLRHNLPAQRR